MAGERILIVEDERAVAKGLEHCLADEGFSVLWAETGQQALDLARSYGPHLILLDVRMPGMNGFEVCEQLKAGDQTCDIPVIFISARGKMEDRVKGFAIGGADYITKPFRMEEVLSRVETHLAIQQARRQAEIQTAQLQREITERKRAEVGQHEALARALQATRALRQERDFAESLIETAQVIVLVLDTEGRIVRFNPYMEEISGYRIEEVRGKDWFTTFLPPRDRRRARERFSRAVSDTQTHGNVNLIVAKDGREREIEWHNKALKDPEGNIVGVLATGQDITEQVRAEAEIHRHNEELATLNTIAAAASRSLDMRQILGDVLDEVMGLEMLTAEATGKIFLIDEQTGELTLATHRGSLEGCPGLVRPLQVGECLCGLAAQRGEMIISNDAWQDERHGCYWPEMPPHKDVCLPLKARDKVLGVMELWLPVGYHVSDSDLNLLTAIGDQIGVAIENVQLYEQAQRRAWELAALNETGRILASSLDLNEVLAQAMVEAMAMLGTESVSVLLYDPTSDELVFTIAADPGSEAIVGARMPATAGIAGWVLRERRPVMVRDTRSDPRHYERIAALANMDVHSLLAVPLEYKESVIGVIEAVNKIDKPFDEHDLDLLIALANSAAGAIENARLFEAEREQRKLVEQSQAQLIHAEKMAALGRLAASIAHEINNPLQAVQGYVALAGEKVDGVEGWEQLARYLDIANTEIDRISNIVAHMREFYRPEQAGFYATDLHAVLEDVLELCGKQLQHSKIAIEREWESDLPTVWASADQLKQVFLNLALNAIDAMPKGGTLRICTAFENPVFSASEATKTGFLRVELSDTGEGIPPEMLPRLFEPFVTTKEKGTGLGLSISYGIIQAHGGEITVTSRVNVGSTFTVLLPAFTGTLRGEA
ncbi:MAG: GAF domain-containing protein [Anaerolineae bacterium]